MATRKTTLVRMFKDDVKAIRMVFPESNMPQFLHTAVRTNFALQAEAILRGNKKKKK